MRIYTKAGDLAFSTFTFPDGQPHFKLETYEIDFRSCTVETAIRNPSELLQTLLVAQTLRQHGYSEINLDVRYLMGARMDRAIASDQPFTLDLIARLINGAGFSKVRILDVHSEVATRLIRNSENVLPMHQVLQVIHTIGEPVTVCPDKGAVDRVSKLSQGEANVVYCSKTRDMSTGNLSGFKVDTPAHVKDVEALIVDDICDGGGTFVGLAKELRKAGARKVYLYITHGIFSKGLPLEGIDHVYTTDSYVEKMDQGYRHFHSYSKGTVIPVLMKEMK